MSEEKNKTELEFMIDKQAKQKYEENLLNLAVAFKENGFGEIGCKLGDSPFVTTINECLEIDEISNNYRFTYYPHKGKTTFETILKKIIPNFDVHKKENIEEHNYMITKQIFDNLSDLSTMFKNGLFNNYR